MRNRFFVMLTVVSLLGPAAGMAATPAKQYCDFALGQCDKVEKKVPEFTRVAEVVAQRHLRGGAIGFVVINSVSLCEDLTGRAGGMVCMGFDRVWKQDRTEAEKSNDVALASWHKPPGPTELTQLQALKTKGLYVVGFGPRTMPELAEHVKLCDAFFDTGTGADDRVVKLPDGTRAGRSIHMINALNGWVFIAELVSALTRQGKMPAMYKSYSFADGVEWGNRYYHKKQFHDDYSIAPIAAGDLGRAYLGAIRELIGKIRATQMPAMEQAAELLYNEVKDGKKALVLPMGHMPYTYVGAFEDARWAEAMDFETVGQEAALLAAKPEGRLALRLGYFGEAPDLKAILERQKMRLIYVSSDNPREGRKIPEERMLNIDTGMEFGDACVSIKDYPIKLFAPSGIIQIVVYEAINTEILTRLTKKRN